MRLPSRATARLTGGVAALVTLIILCGLAGAASAASAVLIEPPAEGPLPASELAQLRTAVAGSLRAQGLQLLPSGDVDSMITGEPQLKGCYTEQCLERIGRLLDSQLVVRYRAKPLEKAAGTSGGWHLNVQILDVEVGAIGAALTEDCRRCTSKQASDQLGDMVKRATLNGAARPRGILQVESQPQSASVYVDGTELGITPYKRPIFAGKHTVVVRHLGYRSDQAETEVSESQTRRMSLNLFAGADPMKVVVVEKTPVYKKWWFWVAIGGAAVAAGAITAGIVLGTQGAQTGGADHTPPPNTLPYMF